MILNRYLISIIIPTFNRGNLVVETIRSVKEQVLENWELIIVDDGSIDNTAAKVAPFLQDSRIKFLQRPGNYPKGGNAARNYGFQQSNGKYIKWLDSDDLLEPNCLEVQLRDIQREDADVNFCRSRYFRNETELESEIFWHPMFPDKNNDILNNFVKGKTRFSTNDGLWRKEILGNKPFEENLKNSQEYLMILSQLAKGPKISLTNQVLVLIRQHNGRMPFTRSYSIFVRSQCLSRFLAINELKKNNKLTGELKLYLIKSMGFYIKEQISKGEVGSLAGNIYLLIKSAVK